MHIKCNSVVEAAKRMSREHLAMHRHHDDNGALSALHSRRLTLFFFGLGGTSCCLPVL